jgi:hypothetical protein
LTGGNGTEGHQEFVVDSLSTVEEQSNNFLDMAFMVFAKEL